MAALEAFNTKPGNTKPGDTKPDSVPPLTRTSFLARAGVIMCFVATSALLISGLVGNAQPGKLNMASSVLVSNTVAAQSK